LSHDRYDAGVERSAATVRIGGPHFEDLEVGQVSHAPALTLTDGHAALHQALTGDRLRLSLDAELSRAVTGREALLAHPNLVCDVAIGQSPSRPSACAATSSTAGSCSSARCSSATR